MRAATHLLLCLICLAVASLGQSADQQYANASYGYRLVVPAGWRIDPGYRGEVPYIYNFPRYLAGPQGQLPDNGAAIQIIPFEMYVGTYVKSFDEWIRWRSRIGQREIKRRDFSCQAPDKTDARVCAEVRSISQLTPEDPPLVDISLYFTLEGKYFCAFLEYNDGDRKADSYLSVLRSITDSVTAQPK